jgi:iron complex outermembrane receptor protein
MWHACRALRTIALALAVLIAASARAQGAPNEEKPPAARETPATEAPATPMFFEEIVVKGKRPPRHETLEVREVRETAARDLGEALEAVGNVSKIRKAGIASDVVLRGMQKDNVNVIVDGAKVHGACPSRMDPPAFHMDYAEIDRVEVKKGPYDVTNPGGLGGLVDVRTRRAHPGLGAEFNAQYGSFQTSETSGVVSYARDLADAQVGGAFKYSQPFVSGDGKNFTQAVPAAIGGQPNGARFRNTSSAQKAYGVATAWGKVGFNPLDHHRLEVSYTRQSATDVLYPYLLMDGIADTTDRLNATYKLDGEGVFTKGLAQLYWSRVVHDMDDRERCSSAGAPATCAAALPRDYSMRTEATSRVAGGKLEAGLSGAADFLTGVDFYLRNWDNSTIRVARTAPGQPYNAEASVPDVDIGDLGLYGQARRKVVDGLHVTVGLRVDVATTHAREDRSELYRTFFPSSGLALRRTDVLPSGNVQVDLDVAGGTVFAGYGHGTRVPDQQERYFALTGIAGKPAWVGFPDLKPMRSDSLDAGAKYSRGPVLVKVQAFHSWIGDYITLTNATAPGQPGSVATAKTYANVQARMYGGEASARLALADHLFFGAGASLTRGINTTRHVDLAEMPPFKAVASLRYDADLFFAEAEEVYSARQDRVDQSLNEQPTAAWFITNVRVGVQYKGLKGFAGVRNLFDKFFYEHLAYLRDPFASGTKVPEPGRAFYGSLQYVF